MAAGVRERGWGADPPAVDPAVGATEPDTETSLVGGDCSALEELSTTTVRLEGPAEDEMGGTTVRRTGLLDGEDDRPGLGWMAPLGADQEGRPKFPRGRGRSWKETNVNGGGS